MINKADGIVLRQIKYSDTSRIITIYTREKGKKAYFLNGIGKKNKGRNITIAQPMALIELIVQEGHHSKGLGRLKEFKLSYPTPRIRDNMVKTSIVLFITEVINKCIKEEEQNERLFDFIRNSIIDLENLSGNEQNFHLYFLVKFTRFLGFHPHTGADPDGEYFDLTEGVFTVLEPMHNKVIKPEITPTFRKLMVLDYEDKLEINRNMRKQLLDHLLTYYQLHLPEFGQLKSHHVLAQVLS